MQVMININSKYLAFPKYLISKNVRQMSKQLQCKRRKVKEDRILSHL